MFSNAIKIKLDLLYVNVCTAVMNVCIVLWIDNIMNYVNKQITLHKTFVYVFKHFDAESCFILIIQMRYENN